MSFQRQSPNRFTSNEKSRSLHLDRRAKRLNQSVADSTPVEDSNERTKEIIRKSRNENALQGLLHLEREKQKGLAEFRRKEKSLREKENLIETAERNINEEFINNVKCTEYQLQGGSGGNHAEFWKNPNKYDRREELNDDLPEQQSIEEIEKHLKSNKHQSLNPSLLCSFQLPATNDSQQSNNLNVNECNNGEFPNINSLYDNNKDLINSFQHHNSSSDKMKPADLSFIDVRNQNSISDDFNLNLKRNAKNVTDNKIENSEIYDIETFSSSDLPFPAPLYLCVFYINSITFCEPILEGVQFSFRLNWIINAKKASSPQFTFSPSFHLNQSIDVDWFSYLESSYGFSDSNSNSNNVMLSQMYLCLTYNDTDENLAVGCLNLSDIKASDVFCEINFQLFTTSGVFAIANVFVAVQPRWVLIGEELFERKIDNRASAIANWLDVGSELRNKPNQGGLRSPNTKDEERNRNDNFRSVIMMENEQEQQQVAAAGESISDNLFTSALNSKDPHNCFGLYRISESVEEDLNESTILVEDKNHEITKTTDESLKEKEEEGEETDESSDDDERSTVSKLVTNDEEPNVTRKNAIDYIKKNKPEGSGIKITENPEGESDEQPGGHHSAGKGEATKEDQILKATQQLNYLKNQKPFSSAQKTTELKIAADNYQISKNNKFPSTSENQNKNLSKENKVENKVALLEISDNESRIKHHLISAGEKKTLCNEIQHQNQINFFKTNESKVIKKVTKQQTSPVESQQPRILNPAGTASKVKAATENQQRQAYVYTTNTCGVNSDQILRGRGTSSVEQSDEYMTFRSNSELDEDLNDNHSNTVTDNIRSNNEDEDLFYIPNTRSTAHQENLKIVNNSTTLIKSLTSICDELENSVNYNKNPSRISEFYPDSRKGEFNQVETDKNKIIKYRRKYKNDEAEKNNNGSTGHVAPLMLPDSLLFQPCISSSTKQEIILLRKALKYCIAVCQRLGSNSHNKKAEIYAPVLKKLLFEVDRIYYEHEHGELNSENQVCYKKEETKINDGEKPAIKESPGDVKGELAVDEIEIKKRISNQLLDQVKPQPNQIVKASNEKALEIKNPIEKKPPTIVAEFTSKMRVETNDILNKDKMKIKPTTEINNIKKSHQSIGLRLYSKDVEVKDQNGINKELKNEEIKKRKVETNDSETNTFLSPSPPPSKNIQKTYFNFTTQNLQKEAKNQEENLQRVAKKKELINLGFKNSNLEANKQVDEKCASVQQQQQQEKREKQEQQSETSGVVEHVNYLKAIPTRNSFNVCNKYNFKANVDEEDDYDEFEPTQKDESDNDSLDNKDSEQSGENVAVMIRNTSSDVRKRQSENLETKYKNDQKRPIVNISSSHQALKSLSSSRSFVSNVSSSLSNVSNMSLPTAPLHDPQKIDLPSTCPSPMKGFNKTSVPSFHLTPSLRQYSPRIDLQSEANDNLFVSNNQRATAIHSNCPLGNHHHATPCCSAALKSPTPLTDGLQPAPPLPKGPKTATISNNKDEKIAARKIPRLTTGAKKGKTRKGKKKLEDDKKST